MAVHVREKPPLRHMVDVQPPAGRHYRLGEDEPDPANVFSGLRYSDTMPGGFETADCTLPRRSGVVYPDLERLSDWRVLGVGGEVYWEGRLERAPRTSGDEVAVAPSAAGWQAALDDDKSACEVYVDLDLSHWRDIGTTRKLLFIAANISVAGGPSVAPELDGTPVLIQGTLGPWSTTAGFRADAIYEAPSGVTVARVYFAWSVPAPTVGTGAGAWQLIAYSSDDGISFLNASADQLTGAASSGALSYTPATARRMVLWEFGYTTGPAGSDGLNYEVHTSAAVYGNHGLTLQGSTDPQGVFASDVVTHAVQVFASQLNVNADSIQQSGFIIPHLVFLEPTTCSEIVRQASRFNLPDWGVWDDREFVWHQPGARGRTWRLRIGPSQLEETGPQADRVWESVIVSYQDVDGSTRTVGPPNSGADTESSDLKDLDPDNPANKLGITRRDILTMGVSTAAGATEIGRLFLEQSRLLDRSGKARVVGWAEDDRGVLHPFAAIRSGDYAVFVDAADTSPRKVVRTDKDYDTRTCTLDLDAPPEGLQQLLERLGVVLVPLGL